MLDTPTTRGPIQPLELLSQAHWSWTLVSEHETSVVVAVTIRNGAHLETSEVEIFRASWVMASCDGPLSLALTQGDGEAEIALAELEDDVACALDSRVRALRMRGARNQDLPLTVKEAA